MVDFDEEGVSPEAFDFLQLLASKEQSEIVSISKVNASTVLAVIRTKGSFGEQPCELFQLYGFHRGQVQQKGWIYAGGKQITIESIPERIAKIGDALLWCVKDKAHVSMSLHGGDSMELSPDKFCFDRADGRESFDAVLKQDLRPLENSIRELREGIHHELILDWNSPPFISDSSKACEDRNLPSGYQPGPKPSVSKPLVLSTGIAVFMTSHCCAEYSQELPVMQHRIYFQTVSDLQVTHPDFGFVFSNPRPVGEESVELMFANPRYLLVSFSGEQRRVPTL